MTYKSFLLVVLYDLFLCIRFSMQSNSIFLYDPIPKNRDNMLLYYLSDVRNAFHGKQKTKCTSNF